ncbi:hypothetical protein CDAR_26261 [Caerostris darwini]|uniref:Secreted protein n=1 Tax=Caerostris darwini TaxID=1538125 RepID=A0AAV4N9Q0_9ARAC|nr:hypothetical protein CDAR_26261 [Caerostris darwini]
MGGRSVIWGGVSHAVVWLTFLGGVEQINSSSQPTLVFGSPPFWNSGRTSCLVFTLNLTRREDRPFSPPPRQTNARACTE